MIKKVVRLGTMQNVGSVFCSITYDEKGRLSISGVEGPRKGGHCRGSCGQIEMGLGDGLGIQPAPGWTPEEISRFLGVWRQWHLNDMRAGCEHQRELGWAKYDEHPSEPCPTCGYKYGNAWLYEEVPASIVAYLTELPETDRTPAWV